jgi:transposase
MKQNGSEFSREVEAGADRLLVSFELGRDKWVLGLLGGAASKPRKVRIRARDLQRLGEVLAQAKERFGLPAEAPVASCYEAGRDGFWLHRYLLSQGIANRVVDSSSIEVSRRARRPKTDRLDAEKLVLLLWRELYGPRLGRRSWSVVRAPAAEQEDTRQDDRERRRLRRDRQAVRNEMLGLLAAQGVYDVSPAELAERLDTLRLWDGAPLPPRLRERLERSLARLRVLEEQLAELEQARRERVRRGCSVLVQQVRQLTTLRSIGETTAFTLAEEFGWRDFKNARQVGAAAGLTGSPWSSGALEREQGISRAGNPRVRATMVNLSWLWLRHQPRSALSQWHLRRFARGNKRQRRVGIVALARKLLIALWRFWSAGVIPEGAQFKTAV